MKRVELPPREPDQRIAGTEGVVQEGEGMVLRQGDEPERQLGEVDRLGVAVHAVEAALRDLTAGEDDLVLVRRNLGHGVVRLPGRDQRIAELAAGFDQECAGAHGGVADLEVENLFGTERSVAFGTQAVEDRRERGAHDRFGELAGSVVRARPAPFLARLQHHRALGHEVGVAFRSMTGSRAAWSASMVPALRVARRSLSVSFRSVRSCSHLARVAGG